MWDVPRLQPLSDSSRSEGIVQIYVRTATGQTITLDVLLSGTVEYLKMKIAMEN